MVRQFVKNRRKRSPGKPKDAEPSRLTPIRAPVVPGRNQPCECGSGVKRKRCCGKPVPPPAASVSPYVSLQELRTPEDVERQQAFITRWGFAPSEAELGMTDEEIKARLLDFFHNNNAPAEAYALEKLGYMVTRANLHRLQDGQYTAWREAIAEYAPPEASDEASAAQV